MIGFYIYLLDDAGHIRDRIDEICASDADALRIAADRLAPGQTAEIWIGARRLGQVTALAKVQDSTLRDGADIQAASGEGMALTART
jgi:hypothetical protein